MTKKIPSIDTITKNLFNSNVQGVRLLSCTPYSQIASWQRVVDRLLFEAWLKAIDEFGYASVARIAVFDKTVLRHVDGVPPCDPRRLLRFTPLQIKEPTVYEITYIPIESCDRMTETYLPNPHLRTDEEIYSEPATYRLVIK